MRTTEFFSLGDLRLVEISDQCCVCGIAQSVVVGRQAYFAWKRYASIQDAFPELTAEQREMLISGMCPKCWEDFIFEGAELDD